MAHPAELNERLRRLRIEPAPPPWVRTEHTVGGLTEVGYAPASDLLLVVSSGGRGLFDGLSGQRLSRP